MDVAERYSHTLNTTNLMDDPIHHNTDILSAVALSSTFGSMMYRARFAGDFRSASQLAGRWVGMVSRKAKRGGWLPHAERVAEISLTYWLDSVCKTCGGRGRMEIKGTGVLDQKFVCPECKGGASKRLQCDDSIKPHVTDCISTLNSMMYEAGAKARRKLY